MAATAGTQSVHRRLASGVVYNFIAAAFAQGSTFIVNVLLSRYLGRTLFGQYSVVQVTLAAIANASLLSMSSLTTKFVAEHRTKNPSLASRALTLCSDISTGMGLFGMVGTALLAGVFATHFLHDPSLTVPIALGSVFVLAQNRSLFYTAVLAGLEEYKRYAIAGVISGITYIVVVYMGGRIGFVSGAAAGLSAAAVIFWIVLWVLERQAVQVHGLKRERRFEAFEKDLLAHFAAPAIVCGYVLLGSATWMTGYLYSQKGADETALYAVATNLRMFILFVPLVVSQVSLSLLNNTLGTRDFAVTRRLTVLIIAAFTGLVVLIVWLFGQPILSIFGPKYAVAYPVLLVLAISTVAEGYAGALRGGLNAHRLIWHWLLFVIVPWQVTMVASTFFLVPRYGALGAAYAYLAGAVVYALACTGLQFKARPLEEIAEDPLQ